jgi:hypothetical protein
MTERRRTKRFELFLPMQICVSRFNRPEFHSAHLRDISTHGIYFHSEGQIPTGTNMELTFSLPLGREHETKVLVRASGRALRVDALVGEEGRVFGVAAALDRIDFVRPGQSVAA